MDQNRLSWRIALAYESKIMVHEDKMGESTRPHLMGLGEAHRSPDPAPVPLRAAVSRSRGHAFQLNAYSDDVPPQQPARVLEWAGARQILGTLTAPAQRLRPWAPRHIWHDLQDLTVRQCLHAELPMRLYHCGERLKKAAQEYLARCAHAKRRELERVTLWNEPVEEPHMAELDQVLRRALARILTEPAHREPGEHTEATISVLDQPPRFRSVLTGGTFESNIIADIGLTSRERGLIAATCMCRGTSTGHYSSSSGYGSSGYGSSGHGSSGHGSSSYGGSSINNGGGSGCLHIRATIELLLDAIHTPTSQLRAEIEALVAIPSWTRFVDHLERSGRALQTAARHNGREAEQAAGGDAERLVWRIRLRDDSLELQPALQQKTKRGVWSKGKKLSLDQLGRHRDESEAIDRAVIDTLIADRHSLSLRSAVGSSLVAPGTARHLLDRLIDHPRVFSLDEPQRGIHVRRTTVGLRAEIIRGNLNLEVMIGNRRRSPTVVSEWLIDENIGAHLAADGNTLDVFPLSRRAQSVFAAIGQYGCEVPEAAHDRVADVLSSLSSEVSVELPDALRGHEHTSATVPVLRLEPHGPGLRATMLMRPISGHEYLPGEGPVAVFSYVGDHRIFARRNLRLERERARTVAVRLGLGTDGRSENGDSSVETLRGAQRQHLDPNLDPNLDLGPGTGHRSGSGAGLGSAFGVQDRASETFEWTLATPEQALDVVHAAKDLADDVRVEWPDDATPWRTSATSAQNLRLRVDRVEHWFGVQGKLEVDGEVISLMKLLEAARSGQRYVEVSPHRFARIEASLEAQLRTIDDVAFVQGTGQDKILAVAGASLETIDALDVGKISVDAEWRALRKRIAAARRTEPAVPDDLNATLRSYQVDGYAWLARLSAWGAGGCLADDMGLGKTIQTITLLLANHRQAQHPSLVVAPTSVGPNWVEEIRRFAPALAPQLYRGPDRTRALQYLRADDVLVTSYDILAIDREVLANVEFDIVVLDEAQAIKNSHTQRARAARSLKARWRLALTGTPIENHLGELWSIFSVISPGLLGSWEHFRDRFALPIERRSDADRLRTLSERLRPFLLRRTKEVVAPELPPCTEVVEPIVLSKMESKLYDTARAEALGELVEKQDDAQSRIQIFAALTRLRRLACHPSLVVPTYRGRSSKLKRLMAFIEELKQRGQRALIFSQFTGLLALVRADLDLQKMPYLYLDGKTPAATRPDLVKQWHDQAADLFLISLKAGGTGLNLTGADYVFHLDPWWNPAVENQATDRTHRIGQTKPVTVVRLIAQGTIEEAVLGLHETKTALADGLLEGTDKAARLSTQALIDLVRVGMDVDKPLPTNATSLNASDEDDDDDDSEANAHANADAGVDALVDVDAGAGD
ncbi:MAG: DEAD/DEAH box helicase [Deltaproteobacteria bacterium]|nr:DEAD/DEAH box helicase [Deltaproteobacteria bacterium]